VLKKSVIRQIILSLSDCPREKRFSLAFFLIFLPYIYKYENIKVDDRKRFLGYIPQKT